MFRLVRSVVPMALAAGALAAGALARDPSPADDGAAARRDAAKALAGLVPGKSSSCLPAAIARSASSRIYGSTIIYTASSGLKYRNDTDGACAGRYSRPDDGILLTSTPLGQTCSGDPARVVQRYTGALMGVCSFGRFVPYRRPPRD